MPVQPWLAPKRLILKLSSDEPLGGRAVAGHYRLRESGKEVSEDGKKGRNWSRAAAIDTGLRICAGRSVSGFASRDVRELRGP